MAEYYVLDQDTFQVEVMTNLDKVPAKGAVICNIVPKAKMHRASLCGHSPFCHKRADRQFNRKDLKNNRKRDYDDQNDNTSAIPRRSCREFVTAK